MSRFEILPGAVFGPFLLLLDLEALLPCPGRGQRFLALDRRSFEEVVVTFPDTSRDFSDPNFQYNLRRHLKISQKALHPSLITPYELHLEGATLGLASAWVPGVPLDRLLAEESLEVESSLALLWEISHALVALHGSGAVHGEVRKEHVLIRTDGKTQLLGHLPFPLGYPAHARRSETVPGVAPEVESPEDQSPASDVYALGLLALELLSHPLAYEGLRKAPPDRSEERSAALASVLDGLRPGVSHGLRKVLVAMVDADPSRRPGLQEDVIPVLMRSLPKLGPSSELSPTFRLVLAQEVEKIRGVCFEAAKDALEADRLLEGASFLHRTTELAPLPSESWIERAAKLLRSLLWKSFLRFGRGNVPGSSGIPEALCLQVFRSAFDLGLAGLISVARYRLGEVLPPENPMSKMLPSSEEYRSLEERSQEIRRFVLRQPGHADAILGLALVTPAEALAGAESTYSIRAKVLEYHRAFSAALYHRSRELLFRPHDPELLKDLSRLAEKATQSHPRATDSSGTSEAAAKSFEEAVRHPTASDQTPPPMVLDEEEAEVLFTQGQILIREGKIRQAAECFRRLLERGYLRQDRFYSVACQEVRNLIWSTWTRPSGKRDLRPQLIDILGLAQSLELESLLPLCDRLLLGATLGDEGPSLEELRELRPRSVGILEAYAAQQAIAGNSKTQCQANLTLAEIFLEEGMAQKAAQQLAEAEAILGGRGPVEGLFERLEDLLQRDQEGAQIFEKLRVQLPFKDPEEASKICERHISTYPNSRVARQEAARRSQQAGNPLRAARHWMEIAKRHYTQGEFPEARQAFREVLRLEPDHREALLYIASLVPPDLDESLDGLGLRIELLAREELFQAALHQGRRELRGNHRDLAIHSMLVEVCQRGRLDPSDYLLAQVPILLELSDRETARELVRRALSEAEDPEQAFEAASRIPGIQSLFSPTDLFRFKEEAQGGLGPS